MILEHAILAALYILGALYQVMRCIGDLRKKFPELSPGQLFSTYWKEEWNTLIVSALGIITLQLFGFIAHYKEMPIPDWLHDWGVYLLTPAAGWGWHRIVYRWLGTTEDVINKRIDSLTDKKDV